MISGKSIFVRIVYQLKKVGTFIAQFLYVQLFITLISLPILVAWGMPFSLLTFVGNLVFNQVLLLFLLLSSVIFFGHILQVPTGWAVYLLEKITSWWLWFMDQVGNEWLVALPAPPWYILIAMGLSALAVCHLRSIRSALKGAAVLSILFGLIFISIRLLYIPKNSLEHVAFQNKQVPILNVGGSIIVIDPGIIGSRICAKSWCEYTLTKALAQKMGASTIDHFIVMQPNILIFDALTMLCQKIPIRTVYIPWWQGRVPVRLWRAFCAFRKVAQSEGIRIIRIDSGPVRVWLPSDYRLIIEPLDKRIKGEGFDYPCLHVVGEIDNIQVNIYSAKSEMCS